MDIEKTLKVVAEQATGYFTSFVDVLAHPVRRFEMPAPSLLLATDSTGELSYVRLSPQVWTFLAISVFLGATVQVAGREKSWEEFGTALIIIVLSWVTFASALHGLCRLLRGKGPYEYTISVSLQILSVTFVISNLAGFLLSRLVADGHMTVRLGSLLAFEFCILIVYWPVSLITLHRLPKWSWPLLALLASGGFVALNLALFVVYAINHPERFNIGGS